jgi:hypothetical protein
MRAEGRATMGRINYAGRPPSASTATGFGQVHAQVRGRRARPRPPCDVPIGHVAFRGSPSLRAVAVK